MNRKTKSILTGVAVFLFTAAFFAFVAWCEGFNFDHRGSGIGFAVFMFSLVSIMAGVLSAIFCHDEVYK